MFALPVLAAKGGIKGKPTKPGPEPGPGSGHHGVTTYEGSKTCNQCHEDKARQVYSSEHYQWKGKLGAINDFCTYPDANWLFEFPTNNTEDAAAGCATCHVGFGDTKPSAAGAKFPATPTQAHLDKIDCLMCHSDTYNHVGKMVNGQAVLVPDAASQADMAAILAGIKKTPSKQACLKCHAKAGGGNGIKQGDLDLSMADPPHDLDVHMASTSLGGAGFTCVSCHTVSNHKIAGKGSDMRVADAGSPAMKSCATCHGSSPHDSGKLNKHISDGRADCTACHIPTYGRGVLTESRRDFTDLVLLGGKYEARRTEGMDLTPKLLPYDGTSYFYPLGAELTKTVSEGGMQRFLIAGPNSVAGGSSSGRRYPFKVHTAKMAVDAGNRLIPLNSLELWENQTIASAFDGVGSAAGFVETVRYLGLYHQVAPKEEANNACMQCHGSGRIND
ncbi:MAG: multiheme c-type cytochrome [Deltaproteobacteria bacterium]|nr:multiheme c-type cytochrome [Deltaproteobacteria bacterium]